MVKACLRGKMAMLRLYAHGTDYSISVAIVRLADVAAFGGGENANEGERKGAVCHSLGVRAGCSSGTNVHSLLPMEAEDESSGEPSSQRGRNPRS